MGKKLKDWTDRFVKAGKVKLTKSWKPAATLGGATAAGAFLGVPGVAMGLAFGGLTIWGNRRKIHEGLKKEGAFGALKGVVGTVAGYGAARAAYWAIPGSMLLGAAGGSTVGAVRVVGPEAYRQWREKKRETIALKDLESIIYNSKGNVKELEDYLELEKEHLQEQENEHEKMIINYRIKRLNLEIEKAKLKGQEGVNIKNVGELIKSSQEVSLEDKAKKNLISRINQKVDKERLLWSMAMGGVIGATGGYMGGALGSEAAADTVEEYELESEEIDKAESEETEERSEVSTLSEIDTGESVFATGQENETVPEELLEKEYPQPVYPGLGIGDGYPQFFVEEGVAPEEVLDEEGEEVDKEQTESEEEKSTEGRTPEAEPDVSDSTTDTPAGGGPQAAEVARLAEEYYTSAEAEPDVSGSTTETPAGGGPQAAEESRLAEEYAFSEETEVDTEAEAEPAMEIPASFEIQQGSNLWDSVAEELKGENGEEPTQEQILFATAKIAEEQGIAVPEWGIEGDMDQTEVPAGHQVELGDETREAINKAMEGDLPPYEEWPGTSGTASPGTEETAEAESSSDQVRESPMQSFNQSVEETVSELGGEEGATADELAGGESQEIPSSQEGGPGYETDGEEGGTESSVDETREQLLINNSNNVAFHLEREIGNSDYITDEMKSNFVTQYQNEFGRIEGTESNSLLQVTDGLIIKNDLEDYYDFVRERSGDSFPTETREEFVEKLKEPLQALRGEGEMSAEEAEEVLTNRILEDIHHTQASILNPTDQVPDDVMGEEAQSPIDESSSESAANESGPKETPDERMVRGYGYGEPIETGTNQENPELDTDDFFDEEAQSPIDESSSESAANESGPILDPADEGVTDSEYEETTETVNSQEGSEYQAPDYSPERYIHYVGPNDLAMELPDILQDSHNQDWSFVGEPEIYEQLQRIEIGDLKDEMNSIGSEGLRDALYSGNEEQVLNDLGFNTANMSNDQQISLTHLISDLKEVMDQEKILQVVEGGTEAEGSIEISENRSLQEYLRALVYRNKYPSA